MNMTEWIKQPWELDPAWLLNQPWVQYLLATDAPALPTLWLMQWAQTLAWGVVLAWLGVWVVGRYGARQPSAVNPVATVVSVRKRYQLQMFAAIALAVSALLPGPWSPSYWLGLAFRAPSMLTVLLCSVLLQRSFSQQVVGEAMQRSSCNSLRALAVMGVVLGWVLLLDTFAVLPVQVYAWGFSPAAVALVILATLLPWVISLRGPLDPLAWTAPMAVVLFVLLRLPSGNVWDAVLDPWLWVVLQMMVVVQRCAVGRKSPPQKITQYVE